MVPVTAVCVRHFHGSCPGKECCKTDVRGRDHIDHIDVLVMHYRSLCGAETGELAAQMVRPESWRTAWLDRPGSERCVLTAVEVTRS